MKKCRMCKEEKDESCFCKNKRENDGLSAICRPCNKERATKYYNENKEKFKDYKLDYYEKNKGVIKERRDHKNLQPRDMDSPRTCTRCSVEKTERDFYTGRSGCKACIRESGRKYGEKNRDRIRKYQRDNKDSFSERHKKYREENREAIAEGKKRYAAENKEKIASKQRKYYVDNREKYCEERRKYREKHRERCNMDCKKWAEANKERRYAYRKRRRECDPVFALSMRVRGSIRRSLEWEGSRKKSATSVILGCSFSDLRTHLGINGVEDLVGKQIDHICPIAQAQTEEEVYKLNHFSNLQVMTSEDNFIKRDNKTPEGERMCLLLLGRPWIDKKYKRGTTC